jgi:hypothetical protein
VAYKATITSASEVTWDGIQSVVIDVTDDNGTVLVTHSIQADVDQIKDEMKNFLREYKKKATSNKRAKVGDFVEL